MNTPYPPKFPSAGARGHDDSVDRQDRLAGAGGGERRVLREGGGSAPRGERLGRQGRGGARALRENPVRKRAGAHPFSNNFTLEKRQRSIEGEPMNPLTVVMVPQKWCFP